MLNSLIGLKRSRKGGYFPSGKAAWYRTVQIECLLKVSLILFAADILCQ